jgi:hypothetical protein
MNDRAVAAQPSATVDTAGYEIRFQSLFNAGRALSFPCDPEGHVNCDRLSEHGRLNYLFARAMVGREFAMPAVRPCVYGVH